MSNIYINRPVIKYIILFITLWLLADIKLHLTDFFCFSEKSEKRFQKKVKSLINVIKFSTITSTFASSKVGPENNNEDDNIEEDIDVLISSQLEHFM